MRAFIVSALLSWVLSLPVLAQSWLDAPFDPDELTSDERRVLQAGLELAGTYYGVLDGIWDDSSTRALADFVADQGGSDAVTYRSLSPVLALLAAEVQSSGWQMQHFSDTDISVALPGRLVQQTGEDGTTWEADDGSVSFSVEYADRNDTRAQHKLIMARRATDVEPFVDETDEWLITSVTLRDGSNAYLRSDRVGDGYVTLFITAEQAQYPLLAFAASSMAAGDLPGFEVPEGGVLEVVQQSRPQAEPEPEPEPRAEPEPEPQAEPEVSSGDAADPDAIDLGKLFQRAAKTAPGTDEPGSGDAILSPEDANGTGSGFYVNPRALVTAAHVVEGCKALSLVDGSQLRVISKDSAMDLAVLESGAASQVWLHISADTAPRLGATVYALGYPYLGLLQQGLSVTGGNISALGGLDPSEERIMISAPVQPGNSGGPLITSQGDVLGVVVSRIDDMSIFDETGTLPQNMNFAVPPRPLVEFLQAAGVDFPTAPPQEVDIAKGLPDTMRDAVVPIFCY